MAVKDIVENTFANKSTDGPSGTSKQSITPAERWVLIGENVYARAQKRGFVGGNPLQDLADAEQEIDAAYDTDYESVFSLTSSAEITEQLKGVFAGYGFDREDLDNLLNGHQEGLEKLAAMNRNLLDNASGLAAEQTQLLQEMARESVKTLQSFAHGQLRPEGVFKIAELSMQAFDNALMGWSRSTGSAANASDDRSKSAAGSELLQGAVVRDREGQSATQLLDAPVTALNGVSDSLASKLEAEFSIHTIRELASNEHAEWARAIVLLAEANSEAATVADCPIAEAREIGESQASLLREEFGIKTVRDLGTNHLFNAAQTIVMLAKTGC